MADAVVLLQPPGRLGVKTKKKTLIGSHLGFQDQCRQVGAILRRQERAIQPVLPLFEYRSAEAVATSSGRELRQQREDPIRRLLEKPVGEGIGGHRKASAGTIQPA